MRGRSPIMPATGGAIVERPGTNFPITSAHAPQRDSWSSLCRTHESGESETRQSVDRTGRP